MTATAIESSRGAIRRTLVRRVGSVPDAVAVADALLSTWHDMNTRVAPVIGTRGVNALFSYTVHLLGKRFPWLPASTDHADLAAQPAGLRAQLAGRDAGDAFEASFALLASFTEQLATLIGESLTDRLLGPVWESSSPVSEQEPTP